MKFRAGCLAHAVDGPRAAVRREVFCYGRVPVAGFVDRRAALEKLIDQLVERRHDFIAMRHGESSAGAEVVLYIDYQESLFRLSHILSLTMLHFSYHES